MQHDSPLRVLDEEDPEVKRLQDVGRTLADLRTHGGITNIPSWVRSARSHGLMPRRRIAARPTSRAREAASLQRAGL